MEKEEMAVAVEASKTLGSVVERALAAYETCKRCDAQIAAAHTEYKLNSRKLDILERELERRHDKAMAEIRKCEKQLAHGLQNRRHEMKNEDKYLAYCLNERKRVFDAIMSIKEDSAERRCFMSMWMRLDDKYNELLQKQHDHNMAHAESQRRLIVGMQTKSIAYGDNHCAKLMGESFEGA